MENRPDTRITGLRGYKLTDGLAEHEYAGATSCFSPHGDVQEWEETAAHLPGGPQSAPAAGAVSCQAGPEVC